MNGLIVGAIWIGIVLWHRQKRLRASRRGSRMRSRDGMHNSMRCNQRVARLEQRLDLSERLLTRPRDAQPAPAPRAEQ